MNKKLFYFQQDLNKEPDLHVKNLGTEKDLLPLDLHVFKTSKNNNNL